MTETIVDFTAASAKIKARRKGSAGGRTPSRPLQSRLLRKTAASMSAAHRAIFSHAVVQGIASGSTTGQILLQIQRDAVRQAARASL